MVSGVLVAFDKYPTYANIKKIQSPLSFSVTLIHFLISIIISIATGQYIGSVDKRILDAFTVAFEKNEQHSVSYWVTNIHCLVSLMISTLTGLYVCLVDGRFTKKHPIGIGIVTILHFLFLFNPWIAEYDNELIFQIEFHHIIFFSCLVIIEFMDWLERKGQSKRKQPVYKVIYGGNDIKKVPFRLKSE
uniref:TMhelix containing protein n=2 Tax=Caenorhabditis tropicalis TaxID=1561998 RepID=A0A1I7UGI5_9PELO